MNISKKVIIVISAIAIGGTLIVGASDKFNLNEKLGFGKVENEQKADYNLDNKKEDKNIENDGANYAELKYEIVNQDENRMTIHVKNESDTDITLNYTSGQKFDIKFKKDGKDVYTWSSDKSFIQTLSEKIIKPEESEEYVIELGELTLEKGTYDFEFYSVAKELKDISSLKGSIYLDDPKTPLGQ